MLFILCPIVCPMSAPPASNPFVLIIPGIWGCNPMDIQILGPPVAAPGFGDPAELQFSRLLGKIAGWISNNLFLNQFTASKLVWHWQVGLTKTRVRTQQGTVISKVDKVSCFYFGKNCLRLIVEKGNFPTFFGFFIKSFLVKKFEKWPVGVVNFILMLVLSKKIVNFMLVSKLSGYIWNLIKSLRMKIVFFYKLNFWGAFCH
jgi:hypothetical protein